MREIKFRAKDFTHRWNYGFVAKGNERAVIFPVADDGTVFLGIQIYVLPDTIGQYTGMHDKNGKEIYEGDILLWTRKNVHIEGRPIQDFSGKCVIYYDNDKCGFRFRCKLDCGSCVGNLDFSDDRAKESYIEVIGNIYDNPKLLKRH